MAIKSNLAEKSRSWSLDLQDFFGNTKENGIFACRSATARQRLLAVRVYLTFDMIRQALDCKYNFNINKIRLIFHFLYIFQLNIFLSESIANKKVSKYLASF